MVNRYRSNSFNLKLLLYTNKYTNNDIANDMFTSSNMVRDTHPLLQACIGAVRYRDLKSFQIRFEFESAVPIRFDSDGPCLPVARSSQVTQTINSA